MGPATLGSSDPYIERPLAPSLVKRGLGGVYEDIVIGPFQIAKKTVCFYGSHFRDCLLFGILSQIVSIVGMVLSPLKQLSGIPNLSRQWLLENLGQAMTIGVISIAWLAVDFWIYLLIAGTIVRLVWKRNRKEEAQAFSSYLQTFEQGGPLLWANTLTAFVIGGAILLVFLLFFLQTKIVTTQWLFSLLLLAMMGAVVFLCLKFSLVTPVVLLEGSRGVEAIKRSWRLMTGNEWKAFTLFSVFFTFLIFFGILTDLLHSGERPAGNFSSWQILESLIGIFVAPIFPIGVAQFYQAILESKQDV